MWHDCGRAAPSLRPATHGKFAMCLTIHPAHAEDGSGNILREAYGVKIGRRLTAEKRIEEQG